VAAAGPTLRRRGEQAAGATLIQRDCYRLARDMRPLDGDIAQSKDPEDDENVSRGLTPINPKSDGTRRRPRMAVEASWSNIFAPWPVSVMGSPADEASRRLVSLPLDQCSNADHSRRISQHARLNSFSAQSDPAIRLALPRHRGWSIPMTGGGTTELLSYTAAIRSHCCNDRFQPVSSACHLPVLVTKKDANSPGNRRGTGSGEERDWSGKTDRGLAFTAPLDTGHNANPLVAGS